MSDSIRKVNVIGHLNPDTDSICAAISYAYLKNQLDQSTVYEARRAGAVNRETGYALKHFGFEENQVFPYVEALLRGDAAGCRHLSSPWDDHTNICEKIGDLKAIVMKYLPGECDNDELVVVLSTIYSLAEDIDRHSRIEDTILVPLVRNLEEGK